MTGSDVSLERIKSSDAYNLISLHESLEDNHLLSKVQHTTRWKNITSPLETMDIDSSVK